MKGARSLQGKDCVVFPFINKTIIVLSQWFIKKKEKKEKKNMGFVCLFSSSLLNNIFFLYASVHLNPQEETLNWFR